MKNKFLCLALLIGLSFQAQADPVISFDPSFQNTGIGHDVSVDIRISGLGDDILTGWDLDIFFDDTLLQFDSFDFGTGLDVLGLGSIQDAFDLGFGWLAAFEVSLDFDEDLELFQPDDFVLGTLNFTGLAFGVSALDIVVLDLGGAYEFDPDLGFDVPKQLFADVEGGAIEVPEPATLLLFMAGLLGMGMHRRVKAVRA